MFKNLIVLGLFYVWPFLCSSSPVIGMFTQDWDPALYNDTSKSYIAMQYVQFLEFSGAQVVPIMYDSDETTLRQMFAKINGLFLPGGGADLVMKDKD